MTHIATAKAIMGGAIEQLRQNARAIARHIGPAYLTWVLVTIVLQWAAHGQISAAPLFITFDDGETSQNASGWLIALSAFIHTAAYIYIAVAWHRVALRPDTVRPDAGHLGQYLWRMVQQVFILVVPIIIFVVINVFASVSAITGAIYNEALWPLGQYLWRMVQQVFILVVPIIIFVVINVFASVSAITGAIYNEALWPLALSIESVLNFIFFVCICWVLLRFGLILPAAAVGHDGYELGASWKDTARYAWPLVWIALVEAGIGNASAWLVAKAGHLGEGAAFFVDVLTWPLPFLLGLSVLTYLYRGQVDDTK